MKTPSKKGNRNSSKIGNFVIFFVQHTFAFSNHIYHKVISPKNHVKKVYLVDVADPLTKDAIDIFTSGALMLRGDSKPLASAELKIIGPKRALITITEGRYHQVRRMFRTTRH